jgi:hypothetical protein
MSPTLIADQAGREAGAGAGHQRQPRPLPADQQGRSGHLKPRQDAGARKGHRLQRRLRTVLQRRVRTGQSSSVSKVEDLAGKTIGVTRGAVEDLELTKIAPADATIKRYEDNNGTISAFLSGQVDTDCRDRQRGGRRDPRAQPAEEAG